MSADNTEKQDPQGIQSQAQTGLWSQVLETARSGWKKYVLAFILAAALVWFAFKDCDWEQILAHLGEINLPFVGLLFITGIISHVIRSARWILLLKPVADRNISLWSSFYAVIVGYAVNVVLPRGGEIARLVVISRSEKLPWAAVLPTLFIDRVLDIAALAILIGFTLTAIPAAVLEKLPFPLLPWGIAMVAGVAICLALLPRSAAILHWIQNIGPVRKNMPPALAEKLAELTSQFDLGTRCITDPIAYPMIAGLTALMWVCYWLNFLLMVYAFNMEKMVSVLNSIVVFAIGSVGNLIPTPGSVGSFHYLVKLSLTEFCGVNSDLALAYATILHLVAYVGVTVVPAAVCVTINSMVRKPDTQTQV